VVKTLGALVLVVALQGCTSSRPDVKITYDVTGNRSASINYRSESGPVQVPQAEPPWTAAANGRADVAYVLTARISGTGSVGCVIRANDEVVSRDRARGPYAVASCTYTP
jgi:hypothetical protein